MTPLLEARDVARVFGRGAARVEALRGVSLALEAGRSVGLVGESGSGKTTLARILVGLDVPSAGAVRFRRDPLDAQTPRTRRALWRRVQYVHQNPQSALNPRRRVGSIVETPLGALLGLDRAERAERAGRMLERVGLSRELARRRPHALSGGQAQRVAVARALVVEPEVVVLDEPTSALDVTVQARLLALLRELGDDLGVTFLLVSHDLAVVAELCPEVAVMRGGEIVERGHTDAVFARPRHAYTRRLLEAVPRLPRRT